MKSFLKIFSENNIIVNYKKCRRGDSTGLYCKFYKDVQALVKKVAVERRECRGVDSDLELCGEELLEFLREMLAMLPIPTENLPKSGDSITDRIEEAQNKTKNMLSNLSKNKFGARYELQ